MSGRSFAAADEALSESRPLFHRVLADPLLAAGITDEHTVRVAALGPVIEDHPGSAAWSLIASTPVETRLLALPRAGEVTLAVISVDAGVGGTLDILDDLVRAFEAFMGAAFPVSHVAVVAADVSAARGGGGPGGILTVDPDDAKDRYPIAHELAHALAVPSALDRRGRGRTDGQPRGGTGAHRSCPLGRTLRALDRLAQEHRASAATRWGRSVPAAIPAALPGDA